MPLQADGSVYHLGLEPEDLASKVILVGDPGRVSLVSSFFDSVEVRKQNRELHTHTGMYKGKRLSVISTGMGTDNLDIVVNELDALVNIDLSKRCIKSTHQSLELIRLGTCGALQGNIDIHTPIASRYGFGLDGLLHYYRHEAISDEVLVDAFVAVGCATALLDRLAHDCLQGITLTATGFYGPQSRVLRLLLAGEDFIETLQGFQYRHLYFTNLEMETSALYALSRLLGHQALSICIAIANRVTGRFSQGYHSAMEDMVIKVLERI
jgi:uridine phosphorylase